MSSIKFKYIDLQSIGLQSTTNNIYLPLFYQTQIVQSKMSQDKIIGYFVTEVIVFNIIYLISLFSLDESTQFPCEQYVVNPAPFQKMTPNSWISTQKLVVQLILIIFNLGIIVCILIKKLKHLRHYWHFCFVTLIFEIALKIYVFVWGIVGMDIKQKWCEIECISTVCLDSSVDLNFHLYLILTYSILGLISVFILATAAIRKYKQQRIYLF